MDPKEFTKENAETEFTPKETDVKTGRNLKRLFSEQHNSNRRIHSPVPRVTAKVNYLQSAKKREKERNKYKMNKLISRTQQITCFDW